MLTRPGAFFMRIAPTCHRNRALVVMHASTRAIPPPQQTYFRPASCIYIPRPMFSGGFHHAKTSPRAIPSKTPPAWAARATPTPQCRPFRQLRRCSCWYLQWHPHHGHAELAEFRRYQFPRRRAHPLFHDPRGRKFQSRHRHRRHHIHPPRSLGRWRITSADIPRPH